MFKQGKRHFKIPFNSKRAGRIWVIFNNSVAVFGQSTRLEVSHVIFSRIVARRVWPFSGDPQSGGCCVLVSLVPQKGQTHVVNMGISDFSVFSRGHISMEIFHIFDFTLGMAKKIDRRHPRAISLRSGKKKKQHPVASGF